MNNANVITIERNIPIPSPRTYIRDKYSWIHKMEIGDSFVINGNTPDYTPKSVRSFCYGASYKSNLKFRFAVRTLHGNSSNPTAIRVWRTE